MPEIWRKKHPRKVRYVTSGPPRDLVGLQDDSRVENPFQRQMIQRLARRDNIKFAAGRPVERKTNEKFPAEFEMPKNQSIDYYLRKAFEAAQSDLYGNAYWYYREAINKAKTPAVAHRYEQCAASNLREWRRVYA